MNICSSRHPPLRCQDLRFDESLECVAGDPLRAESSPRSSFIPRQPETGMDVGIPACLAKYRQSSNATADFHAQSRHILALIFYE